MRIENLSDSETTRNTYEKDVEYFTPKPVLNTNIPHLKTNLLKNDSAKMTIEDGSLD